MPSRWPAHRSACVVALGVAVATVTCALLVVEQRWSRSPSSTTLLTVSTAPKEAVLKAVLELPMPADDDLDWPDHQSLSWPTTSTADPSVDAADPEQDRTADPSVNPADPGQDASMADSLVSSADAGQGAIFPKAEVSRRTVEYPEGSLNSEEPLIQTPWGMPRGAIARDEDQPFTSWEQMVKNGATRSMNADGLKGGFFSMSRGPPERSDVFASYGVPPWRMTQGFDPRKMEHWMHGEDGHGHEEEGDERREGEGMMSVLRGGSLLTPQAPVPGPMTPFQRNQMGLRAMAAGKAATTELSLRPEAGVHEVGGASVDLAEPTGEEGGEPPDWVEQQYYSARDKPAEGGEDEESGLLTVSPLEWRLGKVPQAKKSAVPAPHRSWGIQRHRWGSLWAKAQRRKTALPVGFYRARESGGGGGRRPRAGLGEARDSNGEGWLGLSIDRNPADRVDETALRSKMQAPGDGGELGAAAESGVGSGGQGEAVGEGGESTGESEGGEEEEEKEEEEEEEGGGEEEGGERGEEEGEQGGEGGVTTPGSHVENLEAVRASRLEGPGRGGGGLVARVFAKGRDSSASPQVSDPFPKGFSKLVAKEVQRLRRVERRGRETASTREQRHASKHAIMREASPSALMAVQGGVSRGATQSESALDDFDDRIFGAHNSARYAAANRIRTMRDPSAHSSSSNPSSSTVRSRVQRHHGLPGIHLWGLHSSPELKAAAKKAETELILHEPQTHDASLWIGEERGQV